jgi:hypothetical protein
MEVVVLCGGLLAETSTAWELYSSLALESNVGAIGLHCILTPSRRMGDEGKAPCILNRGKKGSLKYVVIQHIRISVESN